MVGCTLTPHTNMPKPSPYTSSLARFGIAPLDFGSSSSPATIAFAEARCEIQSEEIGRPMTMRFAGETMVILGAGGWKEQAGLLSIYDLSSGSDTELVYSEKTYGLGRQGGPQLALHDSRKLIYNGGSKVINAYRYGTNQGDEDARMDEGSVADTEKSVHIVKSDGFRPSGQFAGLRGAAGGPRARRVCRVAAGQHTSPPAHFPSALLPRSKIYRYSQK
ncbi:hypothetical protein PENSPDRAFT_350479 [Peniophora sp. CONT]|nr:hypothetical protein PENSPDRAFT_350479 [Peniophora sp. CONT]